MDSATILFFQIIKMFLMMAVGYSLYKKGTVNDDTTARLSNILLNVITPCTLITSFNQVYSSEKLEGLMLSFLISCGVYVVNVILASILYKKESRIEKFSVVFSNAGFLGIPLVTSILGIEAVFYLSPFIAFFYIFAWTYGVIVMSGDKKLVTIKKIIMNPCIISVVVGVIVFLLPVKPFTPIMEAVSTLGSMTTPLAMLILGAYLAKSGLAEMFMNKKAYLVSFYRLVLSPLIILFLLKFLPSEYATLRLVILIGASAPVGALAPVFAQMYHLDSAHGAQIVSLSTILCLMTMPLMLILSGRIW